MTTKAEARPYRVSMRVTSIIDVNVDANTIEEARGKAFEWCPEDEMTCQEISGYWLGGDFISEHNELFWEVVGLDNMEILDVTEEANDDEEDKVAS